MTDIRTTLVLDDQMEFWRIAAAAGLSTADIRLVLDYPEVMAELVTTLRDHPCAKLVHGRFRSSGEVARHTVKRLLGIGRNFEDLAWIGSPKAITYTDDPEVAVVLMVTLDTLEKTAEFLWQWVRDQQPSSEQGAHVLFGENFLRPFQGGAIFRPNTLEWVRIKLNAHPDQNPLEVRAADSVGLELLASWAQHPEQVRLRRNREHLRYYLPGLELRFAEESSWRSVLYTRFDQEQHSVSLTHDWCLSHQAGCFSPVRV